MIKRICDRNSGATSNSPGLPAGETEDTFGDDGLAIGKALAGVRLAAYDTATGKLASIAK